MCHPNLQETSTNTNVTNIAVDPDLGVAPNRAPQGEVTTAVCPSAGSLLTSPDNHLQPIMGFRHRHLVIATGYLVSGFF